MKKIIKETVYVTSEITHTYTIDDSIEALTKLKQHYGGSSRIDYGTSGYDSPEISLQVEREESDAEYQGRLMREERERIAANEKKQQSILNKRAKDRALYEKLKKEFEP